MRIIGKSWCVRGPPGDNPQLVTHSSSISCHQSAVEVSLFFSFFLVTRPYNTMDHAALVACVAQNALNFSIAIESTKCQASEGVNTFISNTFGRTLRVANGSVDGIRNAMQELSNLWNTEVAFQTTRPITTTINGEQNFNAFVLRFGGCLLINWLPYISDISRFLENSLFLPIPELFAQRRGGGVLI